MDMVVDGAVKDQGGFSAEKLGEIPAQLQPFIDGGALSGVVALAWRGTGGGAGEVGQVITLGSRDLASGAPMRRDTLFRIASMTKPVTTAAALMLMEAGELKLSDPISRWAPEFKTMRVLKDAKGPVEDTVPAPREITVEDLMTHRAGLAYAFSSSGPIAHAHEQALGHPLENTHTADSWMAAIAKLPLSYPPGERLHYSHATEVLGFIVARILGTTLGAALKDKIFAPLGMSDTDFYVPPEKRDRLAKLYGFDEGAGKLVLTPTKETDQSPAYEAGGGGLYSTVDDYLKFARMLLNDGEVDGVRLLKPETVRDMRTNRLTAAQREVPFLGLPMWSGMGFGLGLSVVDAPEKNMLGVGSAGSFGWPGAYGTWWQADPLKDLITIWMIQHAMPLGPDAGEQIAAGRGMAGRMALPLYQRAVYAALEG